MDKLIKMRNRMESAYDKYDGVLRDLQYRLRPFIKFDFAIQNIPGDGHCILNVDTADVAPIDWCLDEIRREGSLTEDSHKGYCI